MTIEVTSTIRFSDYFKQRLLLLLPLLSILVITFSLANQLPTATTTAQLTPSISTTMTSTDPSGGDVITLGP